MSARDNLATTGVERFFPEDEIIVSKTDTKGKITYANETFLKIAGYAEREVLGQPHNMIRHPDMPRAVFKLLWDTLHEGREIFAYVVNRAKSGDHYWVLAHVTPSFDKDGAITGYHSSRRVPERRILDQVIIPFYRSMREMERQHDNPKEGMAASGAMLVNLLREKGMSYEELVFSL